MTPREQAILDSLTQTGACSYEDLGRALRVSTMTVRRSVDRLVQRGLAFKTIGGVRRVESPAALYETAVFSRLNAQRAEKRAIAARVAADLQPGATVFLDGSTTCLELARAIAATYRQLTVISYSSLICLELGQSANKVIGIGGECDPSSLCFTGPVAEEQVARFFVDVAFVSTKGFVPEEGTFEASDQVYRIKQIIAERCRRLTLLVDHTKFGQRALCRVLRTEQLHAVVTDAQAPRGALARLTKRGIDVQVAPALSSVRTSGRGAAATREGARRAS